MKDEIQIKHVPIGLLEYNTGQIEGVPENPRTREDAKQKRLEMSIDELPEMATARPPMVYPYNGKYVVIGGNRRLEAFKALRKEAVPVVVLPENLSAEKLRRIAMLDNESTGETDWDKIKAEWDLNELKEWGIDIMMPSEKEIEKKETEKLSELKFDTPYYEPKLIPNINLLDCVNLEKFDKKIEVIENSNLSQKKKDVLKWFAYRFIKIDFESVANYYAFNASKEEQSVMERLRLVLVDGGVDGFIEDDLIRINECGINLTEES